MISLPVKFSQNTYIKLLYFKNLFKFGGN